MNAQNIGPEAKRFIFYSCNTALIWAASRDHGGLVPELIAAGADVNLIGDNGDSALMRAVLWNNVKVAKMLVSAGADLGIKNNSGCTALDIANENGYVNIARLLQSQQEKDYGCPTEDLAYI